MDIPASVVRKLDGALGVTGRPHRVLDQGEWVDTGCLEWALSPEIPMPPTMPDFSHDLLEAIGKSQAKISAEFPAGDDSFDFDKYAIRLREVLQEEAPPHVKAELDALAPMLKAQSDADARTLRRKKSSLKRVKTLLAGEPVVVYRAGIEWEGAPSTTYNTLVIAPTPDQFDTLRIERTNGTNYGLQIEDVIARLKTLDEKFGIDITGAAFDGVEFSLKRIPKGQEARDLGVWLLEICPDLYEAPTRFPKGRVTLWWD